ncbi:EmrB/QacA subfamily drug resistance transporter [Rhizobium calliandrae]|uniref:EmrB/QacA subfamily drug resistance transporter n=1 Tax=Rhizobium calliandrae TaxID=1312182 RepID=A0ABT7KK85_9HYPH|nr:EmrB/QacA subfamily drug resistance transporter [Rhizobium calliandrae]MDL2408851.1 EmrB/QacA subfamily drug resistance transporter [Rhizobium calliandrae]
MDRKLKAETWALLLLFASFPVVSFGTTGGSYLVWLIGLLSLVLGGLLPVCTRFMDHSGDTVRDVGMEFDDRTS